MIAFVRDCMYRKHFKPASDSSSDQQALPKFWIGNIFCHDPSASTIQRCMVQVFQCKILMIIHEKEKRSCFIYVLDTNLWFSTGFCILSVKKGKYRVQDDSFMIKNPLISQKNDTPYYLLCVIEKNYHKHARH